MGQRTPVFTQEQIDRLNVIDSLIVELESGLKTLRSERRSIYEAERMLFRDNRQKEIDRLISIGEHPLPNLKCRYRWGSITCSYRAYISGFCRTHEPNRSDCRIVGCKKKPQHGSQFCKRHDPTKCHWTDCTVAITNGMYCEEHSAAISDIGTEG